MDEIQLLVRVMAGLAVVATAVLIVLAYSVLGVMKSARRLEERVNRLLDTWEPVAAETRAAVADFTEQSGELLSRLNALSALLHKQALRADSLMNSLATSAERNIDEVQSAVSNTLAGSMPPRLAGPRRQGSDCPAPGLSAASPPRCGSSTAAAPRARSASRRTKRCSSSRSVAIPSIRRKPP